MKLPHAALLLTLLPGLAHAANYGAYLDAQHAAAAGRMDLAASNILAALEADPSNPALQQDAFGLSLLAGRPEAARIAADLPRDPIALLLLADRQARAGDWQSAELAYAELPHDTLLDIVRPLLLAWSQQAQGHTEKALDTLQAAMAGGHMTAFYTLHAALIADVAHRDGLASRLYDQVARSMNDPNVRLAQFLASWQARSGNIAAARATIEGLAKGSPDLEMSVPAMLAAIAQPQVANAAQGIAEVYVGVAGALRREDKTRVPSMVLQLGLRMEPTLTEGHLVAAEMAAAAGHYDQAAAALAAIPQDDPLSAVVQLQLANDDARLGKYDQAVSILDKLAAAFPTRPEPLAPKGDVLTQSKQYRPAVSSYSAAIALTPHPAKSDWFLFYARGAALERLHDWPGAETDMRTALKLYPDQPVVLNFLGFTWADQDRNLAEAHTMIQKALDQRPEDGEIVDSLGWVELRQGDTKAAVRTLEKAAEMEPVDPTITGHLGDAYWDAGRHLEAEDQWRRALVLGPDKEDAARIEGRLKSAEK